MRKRLTDDLIASLKPNKKRYLVYDKVVSGLAVRVSPTGRKTFCIVGRFGTKHSRRKSLGVFGSIGIEQARELAQSCHTKGSVPGSGRKFREVAERFLDHIKHQKRFRDVEAIFKREFIPRWGDRDLGDVKRADILEVIDAALARSHPYAAHHAWAHCRRLYNWSIARGYIEHSPCDRVRPKDIIGEKIPRRRTLIDPELKLLWESGDRLRYPIGPLVHLLMVTGQRRGEVANARREEFDLTNKLWRMPASRTKSSEPHIVPLSLLAIAIIDGLPKHKGFLFSSDGGEKPINGFGKAKRRIDAMMGDVEHFVLHDIRRTVRTRLSQLRVRSEVAEMVIGHGKKGLARVYDQHQYLDEMREALDMWANELSRVVHPAGSGPNPETPGDTLDGAQSA